MPPVMVWTRKKDTSEEMSYLVDYGEKISNLLEDIRALNRYERSLETAQQ